MSSKQPRKQPSPLVRPPSPKVLDSKDPRKSAEAKSLSSLYSSKSSAAVKDARKSPSNMFAHGIPTATNSAITATSEAK